MQRLLYRQKLMWQARQFLDFLFQVGLPQALVHDSNLTTLEFHGMRICSTGFARIDLLHLSKLVGLIGKSHNCLIIRRLISRRFVQ